MPTCISPSGRMANHVTAISPLKKLTTQDASVTQGQLLKMAGGTKRASDQIASQAAWIKFVLMLVRLGGSGHENVETIKLNWLSTRTESIGLSMSETTSHKVQGLAIQLWRGIPPSSGLHVYHCNGLFHR